MEPFLSKLSTIFRKIHTQHYLLKRLEKFKEFLDKGNLSVLPSWTMQEYLTHLIITYQLLNL